MGSARRKTVLWLAGISLTAVVAVAIFGRQQIVERWYIYQLGSDDAATIDHAATRLAAMGSTRAIMPLIDQVPREIEKGKSVSHVSIEGIGLGGENYVSQWYETDSVIFKALYDIGATAGDAIERELASPSASGPGRDHLPGLLKAIREGHPLEYVEHLPEQKIRVLHHF